MQIEQTPLFREAINPWYDSTIMCFIMIIGMDAVFMFSAAGVAAARDAAEYQRYIWFPILLMLMSCFVIFSVSMRIIYRFVQENPGKRIKE